MADVDARTQDKIKKQAATGTAAVVAASVVAKPASIRPSVKHLRGQRFLFTHTHTRHNERSLQPQTINLHTYEPLY